MNNNYWFNELLQGKTFENLRSDVTKFIKKEYSLTIEESDELFQVALVTLCEKQNDNKLNIYVQLSTYLIAICSNIYLNHIKQKKYAIYSINGENSYSIINEIMDKDKLELIIERNDKRSIARKIVAELKDNCKKLLTEFHFYEKTDKEILEIIKEYKNTQSVKNARHKCMEKVKNIAKGLNL